MIAISEHLQGDLINYAAFLGGQLLFLLKRAGSAIRNPNTNITKRRQYFDRNWDTFGIRAAMEFPFFWGYRHYGLASLTAWFGWTPPVWFQVPDNPLVAFFLGYAADSLLDWVSISPKLPAFLRSWMGENVPVMDGAAKLQKALGKAVDAADAATDAAKDTKEAIAKVQDITPTPKP